MKQMGKWQDSIGELLLSLTAGLLLLSMAAEWHGFLLRAKQAETEQLQTASPDNGDIQGDYPKE